MELQISHLIISYNQADCIEQSVLSAIEQDYDNLEVIVSDDGSTDDTCKIVRSLIDSYPKGRLVLVSGPNLGVTGNSNRALRAAKGDLISMQGGDDVLMPGKFRRQAQWFAEHPEGAYCGHDVEVVDADTGQLLRLYSDTRRLISGRGPGPIIHLGPPFAAISSMFRRVSLPAAGFDDRLPIASDWKMAIDATIPDREFGFIDGVYARYRVNGNNVSTKWAARCLTEAHMTLAIVASEHPELASICRAGRARIFHRDGVSSLMSGDTASARRFFRLALGETWTHSPKVPLWLALSHLPQPVLRRALSIRAKLLGTA